eukprot:gene16482-18808_t
MHPRSYTDRTFRSLNSDSGSGKRSERASPEPDDHIDLSARFWRVWERLEFYVWIAFGSYAWYYTVFKILDWHRFPFHLYQFELWMIVVVPIVLIVAMLLLLDYIFAKSKTD